MENKRVTTVNFNEILRGITNNHGTKETLKNLSKLNVNRGGTYGSKGFVGEHMAANEMNKSLLHKGFRAEVVDNNGLADIVVRNSKGTIVKKYQAKFGYENANLDVAKYVADNQTILVTKDASEEFVKHLKSQGAKVERSHITTTQAQRMSKAMKTEGRILKTDTSSMATKGYGFSQGIANCHKAGLKSSNRGAAFGAGFSLATNTIDVISGDKEVGEAAIDLAKDTTVAAGTGYVAGAAITAIGSTSAGAAIGGVAATATTAIASTTVGATAIGFTTAASTAITTGATAILGTGAIATVAVAAAPVVVAGAVLGGVAKLIGSFWD